MFSVKDLKTGDLLVWENPSISKGVWSWMKFIRLFTLSNFGHVSVVVNGGENAFHIEASYPVIRFAPIPENATIYVVPMELGITPSEAMKFFKDKIGLRYGILDALRAWIGLTLKDEDKWQCAELSLAFYRHFGLKLSDAFTPRELVRTIMEGCNKPLIKLNVS